MTHEELLKYARSNYPEGTVYETAHIGGYYCIVSDPNDFYITDSGYDIIESYCNSQKNGHSITELIYNSSNNKWAKIISKPKTKDIDDINILEL